MREYEGGACERGASDYEQDGSLGIRKCKYERGRGREQIHVSTRSAGKSTTSTIAGDYECERSDYERE